MINLLDACKLVLSNRPGKFIRTVNEFDDKFAFVLYNIGENVAAVTCMDDPDVVMKSNGEYRQNVPLASSEFLENGDFKPYKQHKHKEIEELLKEIAESPKL